MNWHPNFFQTLMIIIAIAILEWCVISQDARLEKVEKAITCVQQPQDRHEKDTTVVCFPDTISVNNRIFIYDHCLKTVIIYK
jgi:hypothetical protein